MGLLEGRTFCVTKVACFTCQQQRSRLHDDAPSDWACDDDDDGDDDDVADDGNLLWLIALKPHGQALKRDTFLRHFRVTPSANSEKPSRKRQQ